jgi:hypothetical protein
LLSHAWISGRDNQQNKKKLSGFFRLHSPQNWRSFSSSCWHVCGRVCWPGS